MKLCLEKRLVITFNPNGVHHVQNEPPNELYAHLKVVFEPKKRETQQGISFIELNNLAVPRVFKQGEKVLIQLCDGLRCGSLINDSYGLFRKANAQGIIRYTPHPVQGDTVTSCAVQEDVVIWLATGIVESERKHILERFGLMRRAHATYKLFLTSAVDMGPYVGK